MTENADKDVPVKGVVRRWVARAGQSAASIDKRYGILLGRENFGGMGEHYGYPRFRVGVYFYWGRRTYFVGLSHERKVVSESEEIK